MSPLPVRVDMNASLVPSGEYSGRESYAGCDTSRRASPPVAGTVQMSPPETNAISRRSGDNDGSDMAACGVTGAGRSADTCGSAATRSPAPRRRLTGEDTEAAIVRARQKVECLQLSARGGGSRLGEAKFLFAMLQRVDPRRPD